MNKSKRIYLFTLFICIIIINITTMANGIKNHETWLVIVGAVSLILILAAGILSLMGYKRNKIS